MESTLIILEVCLIVTIIGKPVLQTSDVDFLDSYEDNNSANTEIFNNLVFNFSCKGRPPGLYADQDYDCRIFHVCYENSEGIPVICASETVFDQKQQICDSQENVDCEGANEWFAFNLPTTTEHIEETLLLPSTEEEDVPTVVPLINFEI